MVFYGRIGKHMRAGAAESVLAAHAGTLCEPCNEHCSVQCVASVQGVAMTTSTTGTSTTGTSITATSVASDASEPVALPTLRSKVDAQRQPVAHVVVNKYKTDLVLELSAAALDWRRHLKIDDVIEARIKLRSGAMSKVTGQIVGRSTVRGKKIEMDDVLEYEEIVYSVALLNNETLKKNAWNYQTEWQKLSTALLLVQKADGTHLLDRNGRTRAVTIPITPAMVVAADATYRKVRESLKEVKTRKTATTSKSTNLSTLI